ncbi:MAG TPA: hypothetical protein VMA31_01490 [Bryobacteraceae bacterium]|nr:hypothetical protein [Bryobacteraceae bacterium]
MLLASFPAVLAAQAPDNAAQLLLLNRPGIVTYPLNFSGLGDIRLPLVTGWAASWTATSFLLHGLDATDSYQPGLPVMLDDPAAETPVALADAFTAGSAPVDALDIEISLRTAESAWHGGLVTEDTGSVLAGNNLPPEPQRGIVERPEEFQWFTRDTAQMGGPITRWADFTATATGQWASQTAPQRADGTDIRSRMLFANPHGTMRFGRHDRIDALYSGSRLDLSSGGWPAGIGAILASPVMPTFYGVDGFEDLREVDHFDLVQAGWTHEFAGAAAFDFRYGYSTAHLDTTPANPNEPARIDLLDPAPADAPLSNFAIRTRHEFRAGYCFRHAIFGVDWEASQARNRFQAPGNADVLTVAGAPAYVVDLNTPTETRESIDSFRAAAGDTIALPHGATLDLNLLLDLARGGPISWVSPSPRVGVAVPVPGFSRVTLRGGYARTYAPLAGRYLDFGNPAALSGLVYDAQTGQLVERFGGAYSSIDPNLERPYADQFLLGLEARLPRRSTFSVSLIRRDDKDRIAAVNTGVPASDYTPVVLRDPGPDFIPGTFDDQLITVYAQNPATLGQDRYLLTNPASLRELSEALTADLATRYRFTELRASFAAEKSFGPTNPGNSQWVNDPGVTGSLYSNPNTLINATGHPFLDRAFIGKLGTVSEAPARWGGWRLVNSIVYIDGLPFARQLLVTGLPQGPFLLDATIRGSPEGGNRAQYVLNWNLQVERAFPVAFGRVEAAAEIVNVLNNGNKIVESQLSGPQFNLRPAVALPAPRMLRVGLAWRF